MTAYGEWVTQKEISTVSCVVMPGVLPEKTGHEELAGDSAWKKVQTDRYELRFQEFHFQHNDLSTSPGGECLMSAAADCVLMQFCLNGSCSFTRENGESLGCLKPTEYNMLCLPARSSLKFSFEPGRSETVSVYLEKSFLLKYISPGHAFFRKVQSSELEMLHPVNLVINPNLHRVLHDMISCVFEGHLKKLYTQAKIIELLALQIAQLEEEKTEAISLKQSEVEKMLVVKEIIESNFNESLSLCQLARQVVTNEQYLKKHFKMVCGCTVYNYILRCRMEKAKELLLTGEYKIAEVAELTGYKYATHFTNAFKKFFGYLPQEIKGKAD